MAKRRVYTADSIDVSFDAAICIHSANCLRGLPQVFDVDARPWISPDMAPADEIAEVVERCPSGALQYLRKDGAAGEAKPAETLLMPSTNGPYVLRGNIELRDNTGALISDGVRMTLCRCGGSENKPFCDNTHRKIGFEAG